MMGNSVQALHYTCHGDRRTNNKPNYAARLNKSVACIARIARIARIV